jgi:hypothetical protein
MNQILRKSKKESCMDNSRTYNREYTVIGKSVFIMRKKCIYYVDMVFKFVFHQLQHDTTTTDPSSTKQNGNFTGTE